MKTSDRIRFIVERRQRSRSNDNGRARLAFVTLSETWKDETRSKSLPAEYYVIRAVTILEVLVRSWIKELIDSDPKYLERTTKLFERGGVKIDGPVLQALQGRVMSPGELISHSLAISDIHHIDFALSDLLGLPFKVFLSRAPKRDFGKLCEPRTSAIGDVDWLFGTLAKLFSDRHVLTHEIPDAEKFNPIGPETFIPALRLLIDVMEDELEELIEGSVAFSNFEMGARASAALDKLLAEAARTLEQGLTAHQSDTQHRLLAKEMQRAWEFYKDARARLIADTWRGGSGAGLASTTEEIFCTKQHLEFLRQYSQGAHLKG